MKMKSIMEQGPRKDLSVKINLLSKPVEGLSADSLVRDQIEPPARSVPMAKGGGANDLRVRVVSAYRMIVREGR